jgi:hypothetical protein
MELCFKIRMLRKHMGQLLLEFFKDVPLADTMTGFRKNLVHG